MDEKLAGDRRSLAGWERRSLDLIQRQAAIVAKFEPGTAMHRQATEVLLLLQDSMHAISEAKTVLRVARSKDCAEPTSIR